MWPKIINSKMVDRLFTVALAVLTILLTQGLLSKREYDAAIKKDIEARPTKEQVTTQYSELKIYVDKQDNNITSSLNQHIEESKVSDRNVMELIKSIDSKMNILIQRVR